MRIPHQFRHGVFSSLRILPSPINVHLEQMRFRQKRGVRPFRTLAEAKSLGPFRFCKNAVTSSSAQERQEQSAHAASPVLVTSENVIFILHCCVAREPALGVVPLGRLIG
jgi:hypothetical protein